MRGIRPHSAKYTNAFSPYNTNILRNSAQIESTELFQRKRPFAQKLRKENPFRLQIRLGNQYSMHVPKNTDLDKEKLYGQVLQLKQVVNSLADDKVKLKTKIYNLQKEKVQLQQKIQAGTSVSPKGEHLNAQLKLLYKQTKTQNKALTQQNLALKRSTKCTKLMEYDTNQIEWISETKRLKNILQEQIGKNMGELRSAQSYKLIQDQLNQRLLQNLSLKNKIQQLQLSVDDLKNSVKHKDQKLHSVELQHTREIGRYKKRITEREAEAQSFKQTIKQNTDNKARLLRQFNTYKRQIALELQKFKKEVNRLKSELAQMKQKLSLKTEDRQTIGNEAKKKFEQLPINSTIVKKEEDQIYNEFQPYEEVAVPKVSIQSKASIQNNQKRELQQLALLLTMRVKAYRLTVPELLEYIQDHSYPITIQKVSNIIANQPYLVSSQNQKQCLLKYIFDKKQLLNNQMISTAQLKEKIKKLLKRIELPLREAKLMFELTRQLCNQKLGYLKREIKRCQKGSGLIHYQQLKNILSQIELPQQLIDFVVCKVSVESRSLSQFNYYKFLKQFCDDQKSLSPSTSMRQSKEDEN